MKNLSSRLAGVLALRWLALFALSSLAQDKAAQIDFHTGDGGTAQSLTLFQGGPGEARAEGRVGPQR